MKVLITGGAGYLGSVLTRRLVESGHQVRILDKLLFGKESLFGLRSNWNFQLLQGDVANVRDVNIAMNDVEMVIDLAAIVGDPACKINHELTIQTNFWATRLLADIANANGVKKFIFASTCSVYGNGNGAISTEQTPANPLSLYAETKTDSEQALLNLDGKMNPILLRFATLCGPSHRMRFDLVLNIMTATGYFEHEVRVFGGSQLRPLLDVRDAAKAIHMFLESPAEQIEHSIYNVGTESQNLTIKELGELVASNIDGSQLVTREESTDERSYKVDFSRINNFGFETEIPLRDSVKDIIHLFEAGEVKNFREKKYYNSKYDY